MAFWSMVGSRSLLSTMLLENVRVDKQAAVVWVSESCKRLGVAAQSKKAPNLQFLSSIHRSINHPAVNFHKYGPSLLRPLAVPTSTYVASSIMLVSKIADFLPVCSFLICRVRRLFIHSEQTAEGDRLGIATNKREQGDTNLIARVLLRSLDIVTGHATGLGRDAHNGADGSGRVGLGTCEWISQ